MGMDVESSEQDRLAALDRYDILDTPPEEAFDRLTRLTRRTFGVSMSTITLIDGHRQWFKSRQGLNPSETPKSLALCAVAIREGAPLVVPDTLEDTRFSQNPLVLGDPRIRFYAGVPLRTPDGHSIGTLCAMDTSPRAFDTESLETLADLAKIVTGELELRVLATTDGLTGTLTRRAFRAEAGRAVGLAQRHKHPLSCLMIDLDRFKSVNDTYGHAVGDAVLFEVAEICRANLRQTDVIGRLGGEEFAVVLPHTSGASALEVAEKLRAAIARLRVPAGAASIGTSVSLGVACLDANAADIDEILRRADAALYAAKEDGRNRCVSWTAPVQQGEVERPSALRRVLKAGRITFNGGRSTIDCTIRGLSEKAARLAVSSSAGVPEQFKLQIEADGFYRLATITQKTESSIEVDFV